jgi:hypothetical protein
MSNYACAVDFFDVKLWEAVINCCLEDPGIFWQQLFSCDDKHPERGMTHVFTDQQIEILKKRLGDESIDPAMNDDILSSWQNFNSDFRKGGLSSKNIRAYYISFDLETPLEDRWRDVDYEWLKASALKLPECDNGILPESHNVNDYSRVANNRWNYLRAIFKFLKKKLNIRIPLGSKWMYYLSSVPNNALKNLIILCRSISVDCLFKSSAEGDRSGFYI